MQNRNQKLMKYRNHNESNMISAVDNVYWLHIRREIRENSYPIEFATTDILNHLDSGMVSLYEMLHVLEDDDDDDEQS